jgi:hypothetical protein
MGLQIFGYGIDFDGQSIVDIGGGPYSMLLKRTDFGLSTVIDPGLCPEWVAKRYEAAGITGIALRGEDIVAGNYDEALIYNCLQHVEDPERIVRNVKRIAKVIRVFEWIDAPTDTMHLHTLKEDVLNVWFGGTGKTERINEPLFHGYSPCYYGIFLGEVG